MVTDMNGEPVVEAAVFFNNTSFKVFTDEDGAFELNTIPEGTYDLSVEDWAHESYVQVVNVQSNEVINITLQDGVQLEGLVAQPYDSSMWEYDYAIFKKIFLGSTNNGQNSTIKNPKSLIFSHQGDNFIVSSKEPVIVRNKNLGYKINYYIQDFQFNSRTKVTTMGGNLFFDFLKGGKSRQKKWIKHRNETYLGSLQHFIVALYRQQLEKEDFEIRLIKVSKNPNALSELEKEMIRSDIRMQMDAGVPLNSPEIRENMKPLNEPEEIQYLINQPVSYSQIISEIDQVKYFSLPKNHRLNISHPNMKEAVIIDVFNPVQILPDGNYAPLNILSRQGDWVKEGVADLLPLDYKAK